MASIQDYPFVTVIMPIRNEAGFIERSLGAVLNQSYPAERVEVLIADGMSDDGTLDKIRNLSGSERVHIIPNPKRIQSAGLNQVIPQARGDIIIRVDGHTIIAQDYIQQCVNTLKITQAQNVGGPMDPVGITALGKAIAAAGKSSFAVPSAFHVSQQAQYTDTVYLGAWPRQVFEQVGLYNEHVGVNEDYELNYRIRQAGGKIYFTPAIQSQYFGRQTLAALARQYFRYGRSKIKMLRAYPASLRLRQVVAPIFVAGLIIGAILAAIHPPFAFLWLGGVLSYGAVNVFFSARIASQTSWTLIWRLMLVFFVIHMSWGLGFWLELFQKSP